MKELMTHIRKLAVDIGPRGSATAAEAEAAKYVTAKFTEYGLEAWSQQFKSITTFSWSYLLYFLFPTVSVLIAQAEPWFAAAVMIFGAGGFLLELNSWPVLSRLLPKAESINAIARRKGDNVSCTKVVILAHLDSSKAALNFKPGIVENFRKSFVMMVVSMLVPAVALLIFALTGWFWLLVVAGIFALYLLITAGFLLHREAWNRYTHGANDNASGVAVLLGLARDAGKGAFPGLDLWFVATGSEEAGTFGAAAFLAEYGDELRDAYFINLDNVGAGVVHYMAGEGMFPTHRADRDLLALANKVQAENPELGVKEGVYTLMSTDVLPVLVRGYKGISFLATRNGLLPNWHWVTDTYENVEEATVETCYRFVGKMLEKIAQEFESGETHERATGSQRAEG
ncbi:MAG: M28 family peptidase [Firmicutes bacterium]|nr:M28 family peptidase [Bacillota bacterium]